MELQYSAYHVTHFQLTKWCTGIVNQQSWTFLMFRWSSSILRVSEPASMTSSSLKSRIHKHQWFSWHNCLIWTILQCRKSPIFIMMLAQWCHHFSLSGYSSAPTRVPPISGLQYFDRVPQACIVCEKTIFIWIRDSQPARIWTRISKTKTYIANHWATLHGRE